MKSLLSFFVLKIALCCHGVFLVTGVGTHLVGGGCGMSNVGAGEVVGQKARGALSPPVSMIA